MIKKERQKDRLTIERNPEYSVDFIIGKKINSIKTDKWKNSKHQDIDDVD